MNTTIRTKLPPVIDSDVLFSGWTDIRSSDGTLFRYALVNRHTHIDIGIQTPRSPRGAAEDDNYHLVHKMPLGLYGNTKICIKEGKEPKTVEKAMGILREYIDLYAIFLKTGKSIDEQIKELRN